MARLIVDVSDRTLRGFARVLPCAIGRSGTCAAEDKREGDGRTPIGCWPIRGALLRRDRITLERPPHIPWRWLRPADGWSDDPRDPDYNRSVRRPHAFGTEALWREDDAYNVIVVLGYNDMPPRAGGGSAIFLHMAAASGVTEGCVSLASTDLLGLVPKLRSGDMLDVRER